MGIRAKKTSMQTPGEIVVENMIGALIRLHTWLSSNEAFGGV